MRMSRKLVISSLTLLSAITLAGSISGTIAWYQYSTRALVAYTGTSAHCSKLLQISTNKINWNNNISSAILPEAKFAPITTGAQRKDQPFEMKPRDFPIYDTDGVTQIGTEHIESPFYAQPNRLQGKYDNWSLANRDSYAQFDIFIKVKDVDGESTETNLRNEVFLTDLTIQDTDISNNLDLSSAVRVQISSEYKDENNNLQTKNFLFALDTEEIEVGGFLDVDGDGEIDRSGYEWNPQPCIYGDGTYVPATYDEEGHELTPEAVKDVPVQTSYLTTDSSIIAHEDDGVISGGQPIGLTSSANDEYLKVTITIWLEGWSPLLKGAYGNQNTAIWDPTSYIEQNFNVGMTFGVSLHENHN